MAIREIFFAEPFWPSRRVEKLLQMRQVKSIFKSLKEQMVHEAPKKERDVEKFFLLCMFLGRFGDFEIERVERC